MAKKKKKNVHEEHQKMVDRQRERERNKKKNKSGKAYRIKYDHQIDGRYIRFPLNKEEAIRWINMDLSRFPNVKASLQKAKVPLGTGWKAHSSYKYRYNRKTHRHRLVKL